MKDIEKAVRLYEKMADRHRSSGYGDAQARVYREMAEFMQDCETVREAHEKIKGSKYYLAPGAALLQDKLAAFAKASAENEMADVAQVFEDKIKEIDADVNAMYELGYERKAMNLKIPYLETFEAFGRLYGHYLNLFHGNLADYTSADSALKDLRANLAKLLKPDSDFSVLSRSERFRQLIPVTDEGYKIFAEQVAGVAKSDPDFSYKKQAQEEEFKKAKEALKSEKTAVVEAGNYNKAGLKRSQVTVVAPDSKEGSYTYTNEEVKPFV